MLAVASAHLAAHHDHVVGVDAGGQWPGGDDNDPGADFTRYVFQAPEDGRPEDLFNPVQPGSEVRR